MLAQELRNHHLAAYRDRRLKEVGPQTVKHEINLLRRILKLASDEWGITLPNGVPTIRMPRLPRGRERRVSEEELLAIKRNLTPIMAAIVTIAVETAMRRSEIISLERNDILSAGRLHIRESKNDRSRVIPLNSITQRAVELLLRGPMPAADSVSQAFYRACKPLNAVDLHFHDLRHEAISRMFERGFSVPQVAAISGHEDFRMLARYTHITSTGLSGPVHR
jgi:integrase